MKGRGVTSGAALGPGGQASMKGRGVTSGAALGPGGQASMKGRGVTSGASLGPGGQASRIGGKENKRASLGACPDGFEQGQRAEWASLGVLVLSCNYQQLKNQSRRIFKQRRCLCASQMSLCTRMCQDERKDVCKDVRKVARKDVPAAALAGGVPRSPHTFGA
eukprot:1140862-Pelagomonas_calceolata.AAC.3